MNYREKITCSCQNALSSALITDPKAVNLEMKEKLHLLVKKYI
jgi:hypothetical protein